MNKTLIAAIAVTRFGLGAKPGEIRSARSDPRGYLFSQLRRRKRALIIDTNLASSEEAAKAYYTGRMIAQKAKSESARGEILARRKTINRQATANFRREVDARTRRAVETDQSFLERLVRFWSNHFTVSARQSQLHGIVAPFEREVIRSHVLGSFTDLTLAASFHRAMLIYLDNTRSIGPQSQVGRRRRRGLNENLAREILELHTMGVGAYGQADVEAFAKALTGWTIEKNAANITFGDVVFNPLWHEPGPRVFMGQAVPDDGAAQAEFIIRTICRQMATARHVCFKLIRHFITDVPAERDVEKLAGVFMRTDGNLKSVAKALVRLESGWDPAPVKFKTPDDLVVSAGRILGLKAVLGDNINTFLQGLGQPIFKAPAPIGYSDISSDWIGADALKKRLEWANRAARRSQKHADPLEFFDAALGPLGRPASRDIIAGAGSRAQGLTLALMSPEFQRR